MMAYQSLKAQGVAIYHPHIVSLDAMIRIAFKALDFPIIATIEETFTSLQIS